MPTSDEKEIWQLSFAKAGKEGMHLLAYAEAFEPHRKGIYRLLSRMLQDKEEAEDILQEVFITGWRDFLI